MSNHCRDLRGSVRANTTLVWSITGMHSDMFPQVIPCTILIGTDETTIHAILYVVTKIKGRTMLGTVFN